MSATDLERKPRPTNLDLQDQNFEIHECLNRAAEDIQLLVTALGLRLPTEAERARGIGARKIRPPLSTMNPWQVAAVIVPAVAAGMTAYKVIEPAIVAFLRALHQGLMSLH